MTDPTEMTADERGRVLAAVRVQQSVRMRWLHDGRIVPVRADRVAERLASGLYELAEDAR